MTCKIVRTIVLYTRAFLTNYHLCKVSGSNDDEYESEEDQEDVVEARQAQDTVSIPPVLGILPVECFY